MKILIISTFVLTPVWSWSGFIVTIVAAVIIGIIYVHSEAYKMYKLDKQIFLIEERISDFLNKHKQEDLYSDEDLIFLHKQKSDLKSKLYQMDESKNFFRKDVIPVGLGILKMPDLRQNRFDPFRLLEFNRKAISNIEYPHSNIEKDKQVAVSVAALNYTILTQTFALLKSEIKNHPDFEVLCESFVTNVIHYYRSVTHHSSYDRWYLNTNFFLSSLGKTQRLESFKKTIQS